MELPHFRFDLLRVRVVLLALGLLHRFDLSVDERAVIATVNVAEDPEGGGLGWTAAQAGEQIGKSGVCALFIVDEDRVFSDVGNGSRVHGSVLFQHDAELTLGTLFSSWGEPLSRTRLASFTAAARTGVAVFVDGRPWQGAPAAVPLARHAEIVLEVGPHVPPHSSYTFPPGT